MEIIFETFELTPNAVLTSASAFLKYEPSIAVFFQSSFLLCEEKDVGVIIPKLAQKMENSKRKEEVIFKKVEGAIFFMCLVAQFFFLFCEMVRYFSNEYFSFFFSFSSFV